ncbi:MAG: MFS transporter [bacterium]
MRSAREAPALPADEIRRVFNLQKLYTAFEFFGFSMLLVHFKRYFSFDEIVLGYLLFFLTPLPFILFLRTIRTRCFLVTGFALRAACMVIYLIAPSLPAMLIYYLVSGAIIFLFWVPYNIRYFLLSGPTNRATLAGHLIIVGPILNTFVPFTSGLVIAKFGLPFLISGTAILAALLIYNAARLPKYDLPYRFHDVMANARGLRLLKLVQGVWEAGNMVIALYGLTFLKTEMEYGTYLSYLGLVGVVGALIVTRFSDRQRKRLKFFFPFVIALAALTMSLASARTFGRWTALAGTVGVASTMTYPFMFAIVLDKIEDKAAGMIAREFLLNAGRVLGYVVMLAIMAATGTMRWAFLFTGGVLLLYPVLLVSKRHYSDENYEPLSPVARRQK